MEPYQKASETARQSGESEINLLKNIISSAAIGGGARVGASATSALLPKIGALISKYVPDELSAKGLAKIDPRFGTFIKKATQGGYDYGEVRTFLDEKIKKSDEDIKTKDNRNIVEQYSPELHQFILGEIQKGRSPLEAGAVASLDSKGNKGFRKIIKKIEQDHKAPWSSILETVYGGIKKQQNTLAPQETQPQQQQTGKGQQALMAILQQIQQARSSGAQ